MRGAVVKAVGAWRSVIGWIGDSSFLRNMLVVMTGSAAAQALGVCLSPVISRLFSPTAFGIFGSFSSIANIIAAGVTLDYSQALMLPNRREDALHLLVLSCLSSLSVGALCAITCVLVPDTVNGLMKTRGSWPLVLLVAATLVGGFKITLQAWCVRVKAFKATSASQVVRGVSSNTLQIGFGAFQMGGCGLIVGNVLGDMLASLNLFRAIRADFTGIVASVRWGTLKSLALAYRDFPAYSATQNVLNAVSSGLPVLLLTYYYGITVAGAYAFAMRLLNTPMSLVTGALRQVLFQKAGESQQQGRSLAPLFVKTTIGLFALGLPPSIVLSVWAPGLFAWLFGSEWQPAGEFARYLIGWLLFVFCNVPAILFARLIRIQRRVLCYDVIVLVVRVVALVVGGRYLGAQECIVLFSAVGAGLNLGLIILVGRAVLWGEGQCRLVQLRSGVAGRSG